MSGFGAEFKNMKQKGGAPKIDEEVSKQAEEAAQQSDSDPGEADPDSAVFAQPFADGQTLGDAVEAGDEPPVIPPPKQETKKKIKINGKEFNSEEEAIEYAAQLERDMEKQEAFNKGLQAAQPQTAPKPAEKKKILKIADKLFENPEEAFEELEAHIKEKALELIEEVDNKKTQASVQAETAKKAWDNFYKTNSDLADWQDEVNLVTQREWSTLQHLPAEEGLKKIAELSRAYVNSVKERALPKTALPSKTAQTAGQGGRSTTATQKPATEKKMSFAEQVRSTNRRTAMQNDA